MTEQSFVVQRISWRDLCPWTLIFQVLPVATGMTCLILGVIGAVLAPVGWKISETLFIHQEQRSNPALMQMVERNNKPYGGLLPLDGAAAPRVAPTGLSVLGPLQVFEHLVTPFHVIFNVNFGGWEFCYFLFGGVWSLLIWSFLGLAITRVCLLRLTRSEQVGLDDAFEFAISKWLTASGAVGIPLLAVAVLCVPTFGFGLIMASDFGVLIVGLLWIVVLAIAAVMGVLLLGLLFGWPLMIASVATESQNSFDAMTRSYAYTFQRPMHYLFYLLLAILFGGFCWWVVAGLTDGVLNLAYWSTSWGANINNGQRIDLIRELPPSVNLANVPSEVAAAPATGSNPLQIGRDMIGLWNALARTIAAAFLYVLFWCFAAAIYLLLRHDVDETETDEIFINDQQRTYELPPLKSDENGIPQVQMLVAIDDSKSDESDLLD